MGGQTYLFNLVSRYLESQKSAGESKKVSVLYASEQVPSVFAGLEQAGNVELVACPELKTLRTPAGLMRLLVKGSIPALSEKFSALDLTVVFSPTLYLGRLQSQKIVTWLPDFQHRALPRFFSVRQRLLREISYRLCIRASDKLMLSSNDAAKMFLAFYGAQFAHKLNIVPFTPSINPLAQSEVHEVLKRYNLRPGYFFLPNQFWQHKNHELAISAFEQLCQENWSGRLVMTGSPPSAAGAVQGAAVLERLSRLQAAGRLRHLGSIPRRDFLALLQASGCLINPSRFEGRSSTVEEAIAYEIPMLLSDIVIHREQAINRAAYFGLNDSNALAAAMTCAYPSMIRTKLASTAQNRAQVFSQALVRALDFEAHVHSSQTRTGYVRTETTA